MKALLVINGLQLECRNASVAAKIVDLIQENCEPLGSRYVYQDRDKAALGLKHSKSVDHYVALQFNISQRENEQVWSSKDAIQEAIDAYEPEEEATPEPRDEPSGDEVQVFSEAVEMDGNPSDRI